MKYIFAEAEVDTVTLDGKILIAYGFTVRIAQRRASRVYFYKTEQ